jgi:L-threonylcarbamoyladenylate synthase
MLSITDTAEKLEAGAVGVIPTDTVYGLVCSASIPDAIQRLYTLKHRENKPGTVVAASIDQLVQLGIPKRYLKAVEQYWPNPISIVIPTGGILSELHLGKGSLAVRIPNDEKLHSLLNITGPLLTTSANDPGDPTATTIAMAKQYFNDAVDFYVDGGDLKDHAPSTIIRIVDDAVEILRQGAVHISESGEIK